jgi:hypothetical protein
MGMTLLGKETLPPPPLLLLLLLLVEGVVSGEDEQAEVSASVAVTAVNRRAWARDVGTRNFLFPIENLAMDVVRTKLRSRSSAARGSMGG